MLTEETLVSFDFSATTADGFTSGGAASRPELTPAAGVLTVPSFVDASRDGLPSFIDSPGRMTVGLADDVFAVIRARHRFTSGGTSAHVESALAWRTDGRGWSAGIARRFSVVSDGRWHVYAVPLDASGVRGAEPAARTPLANATLEQLRLYPAIFATVNGSAAAVGAPIALSSLAGSRAPAALVDIDFVRVVRAPTLKRVQGCSRIIGVSATGPRAAAFLPVTRESDALDRYFAVGADALNGVAASTNSSLQWAETYNCARSGGERVLLSGENFGLTPPRVWIGGLPCTDVRIETSRSQVSCVTPPGTASRVDVAIANGDMPVLSDSKRLFSYVQPPPAPRFAPVVANIGAHAVEVAWAPPAPADAWAAMTITGFLVQWRVALVDDPSITGPTTAFGDVASPGATVVGRVDAVDGAGLRYTAPASAGGGTISLSRLDAIARSAGASNASGSEARFASGADAPFDDPSINDDGKPWNAGGSGVSGIIGWGAWGASPGGEHFLVNVTQTTVRGLPPGARIQFRVASVAEPTAFADVTWATGDAFGVRRAPAVGALVGPWSPVSVDARTLVYDVFFSHFDANSTLDHGPVAHEAILNSVGWAGGEGHYGIVLIGSAHIAGCNGTHACCDNFGGPRFTDKLRWLLAEDDSEVPSGEPGGSFDDGPWSLTGSPPTPATSPHLWRWSSSELTWLPLAARDASWAQARAASDALNTGSLASVYFGASLSSRSAAADSGLTAAADLAVAVDLDGRIVEGVSGGRSVLFPERIATADVLLGRAFGSAAGGGWFSALKEERAAVWDELEDAGTLAFVPSSVLARLQANASATDAAGEQLADHAATWTDQRVHPDEGDGSVASQASSWRGDDDDAVRIPSSSRADTHATARHSRTDGYPIPRVRHETFGDDDGSIQDDDPVRTGEDMSGAIPGFGDDDVAAGGIHEVHTNQRSNWPLSVQGRKRIGGRRLAGSSTRPQVLDSPRNAGERPARARRALFDANGRRLVGWPFEPSSACTLVCATTSASRAAGLDLSTLRGADIDGGAAARSANASGAYGAGARSIYGAVIPGLDSVGAFWESSPPVATARVTGRLSRVDAAGNGDVRARVPRPAVAFTTYTIVSDSAGAATLSSNSTAPCGPALRLTASRSSQAGAAWYARALDVRDGFDTVFILRVASPSLSCRTHNNVATRCRSRGGSGVAFVVQTASPGALGNGSSGLGYAGIPAALAVEFDVQADAGLADPGESHIGVMSRGALAPASSNHTFALGAVPVTELADGHHVVRIQYTPRALADDPMLSRTPAFVASPHVTSLMDGARERGSGWSGAISVWLDSAQEPVLVVPADLDDLLGLDDTRGRAWVGFTAATGADEWETHDVLGWTFRSLRGF